MSIGYACLTKAIPNTAFRTCIIKNASAENLKDLIEHNLNSLENIIDYNIKNNIMLFRISSDIIPFGSNHVNKLDWQILFKEKLNQIGFKIKSSGIRVSMHPGQYTVLNSTNKSVVENAEGDLLYHTKFLESLGTDISSKIILHIGGVYGDKNSSSERFIMNFSSLGNRIKDRIVIENDDKLYNIEDVINISKVINIPVVFDNLHHFLNPPETLKSEQQWICDAKETWKKEDGIQKIHYSQQDTQKRKGSHTRTIYISEFLNFYNDLSDKNIDIMLEVKDKNLSAIKCINATSNDKNIIRLEEEWRKYKYKILEISQKDYTNIRELLKVKEKYPAEDFYNVIDNSMEKDIDYGNAVNASSHVWGYFKNICDEKEKIEYEKKMKGFLSEKVSLKILKSYLYKLALKYECNYLLDSYYFYL